MFNFPRYLQMLPKVIRWTCPPGAVYLCIFPQNNWRQIKGWIAICDLQNYPFLVLISFMTNLLTLR